MSNIGGSLPFVVVGYNQPSEDQETLASFYCSGHLYIMDRLIEVLDKDESTISLRITETIPDLDYLNSKPNTKILIFAKLITKEEF